MQQADIGFQSPAPPSESPDGKFLTPLAWFFGGVLTLAWLGVLSFAQPFARSPFFSVASLMLACVTLRFGAAWPPIFLVAGFWILTVWGNKLLAIRESFPAIVETMDFHLANGSKDTNWSFLVFASSRGRMRQYFPIEGRRLEPGTPVTRKVARGPLWTNVTGLESTKWSGEASIFTY